jgi:hypothetical protein
VYVFNQSAQYAQEDEDKTPGAPDPVRQSLQNGGRREAYLGYLKALSGAFCVLYVTLTSRFQ